MSVNNSVYTLSIIIPVYNVSMYVIAAVDSVINQSIKPYEVIIVDDGSTDNSGRLVEEHYGFLPYVKIIHTENQGLGEARNVGTREATGDYIYYFDSDDILEHGLVEGFYTTLAENPDMEIYAFSAESFLDTLVVSSVSGSQPKLPQYRRDTDSVFADGEDAFNALSAKELFFPNAWLYIYKRRLHVEHELFFKPIIHEDEEFTPRLFFVGGKTVVSDRVYFRRRVRAGSIMQTGRSEKNAIGYIRSIEALESLLPVCKNDESRRYVRQRIINNILNIILIQKKGKVFFNVQTMKDYSAILSKYNNFFTRVAAVNFFTYRALRFLSRRLKLIFSV